MALSTLLERGRPILLLKAKTGSRLSRPKGDLSMLAISEVSIAAKRTFSCKEEIWEELIRFLRLYAWRLVRAADVEIWRGQQADLVEDVVQETVSRIVERARRAEAGELPPIESLKGFAAISA